MQGRKGFSLTGVIYQGLDQLHSNLSLVCFPPPSRPGEFLGSGQFGTVYQGEWLTPSGKVPVAVKTLHTNIHESERVRFLQEAAIMCQFNHLHVVKMYGIVKEDPVSGRVVWGAGRGGGWGGVRGGEGRGKLQVGVKRS